MESLKEYTRVILEFKEDQKPKCVIIIGGPGAGKSYWMNAHKIEPDKNDKSKNYTEISGYEKLFGHTNVSKILDMDHNLEQVQKENAKQIAQILLTGMRSGADKKWFEKYLTTREDAMNAAVEYGKKSPVVDFQPIIDDYEWFVEQVNHYKVAHDKGKFVNHFKNEFTERYWNKIFAMDFSQRDKSKTAYKQTFSSKLAGLIDYNEDEELINISKSPSDICIAITGDDIKKIQEVINTSAGTHAIYIVYLDLSEKMSLDGNARRARKVSTELVKQKLDGVHKTWNELLENDTWKKMGIWTMFHMTTPEGKYPQWEVEKKYQNLDMLKDAVKALEECKQED